MRIFGNDGFRSEFGKKYMTKKFLLAFANGIADYLSINSHAFPVLIGKDTRSSGNIIFDIVASTLCLRGVNIINAGIVPSPGLSAILNPNRYSLGIMITASHNPASDNGIKIFQNTGFKLDAKNERKIENFINSYLVGKKNIINVNLGRIYKSDEILDDYIFRIRNKYPIRNGKKIIIDCSNGAFSITAKHALCDYDNLEFVNDKPNGININHECGALKTNNILTKVKNSGFDFGVAFDGDGDRAIFVSREYGVIETEKLIFLFSKLLSNKKNTTVSTEICNKGLEDNFKDINFKLIQTEVGDRNVINSVIANDAILGAEPSGHYYFPEMSNSMDGLIALLQFMELIEFYGDSIIEVLHSLRHYKRMTSNINVNEKTVNNIESVRSDICSFIDGNNEKIVIRQSMWDPLIRVYYDYLNINNFDNINKLILKSLSS